MAEPFRMPRGVTVDAVDWLPSGSRSGLVRVRGRRPEDGPSELPELVLERDGASTQRFASLPDPRADRDPGAWRGAYVVDAVVATAAERWTLAWSDGSRLPLPAPDLSGSSEAGSEVAAEPLGGQVVDPAVLADRRARRAEAAEQASARTAREALRAVEGLELRLAEVEQQLVSAVAERDALRGQAPDPLLEAALHAEAASLRAEVARLMTQEPAEVEPPVRAAGDPARLREALAATVALVADLRLQLHEAHVARRSREVGWSADAVRLTVLAREQETLQARLATAHEELDAARAAGEVASAALGDARAAATGAEAAHEETRRRFTERVAELGVARERIAELEAQVAAVQAEAERAAREAADAVRADAAEQAEARIADLSADADQRIEEARADAAARVEAAEAAAAAALDRAGRAEEAVADALIARELAEAAAVAARAERRAAAVAHAAAQEALLRRAAPAEPLAIPPARPAGEGLAGFDLSGALGAAVGRLREQVPPLEDEPDADEPGPGETETEAEAEAAAVEEAPRPVPVPPEVIARAAEQVRRAAEPTSETWLGGTDTVAADLDAAASTLRRRATIVSAPGDPPGAIVRNRRATDYPRLRGALVKLAHDDPAAAARLLTGLLPGLPALLPTTPAFDLTIEGAGTWAVGPVGLTALAGPRGRPHAAFHLSADATTLAELAVGSGPRPGRRSRARTSGRVRKARAAARDLAAVRRGLQELLDGGARPDPVLALRCLAYAVHPSWTRGADSCVAVEGPDGVTVFACLDDGGLHVRPEPPDRMPDAHLTVGADGVAALLAGDELPVEGDPAVVADLLALTLRAAGGGR